MPSPRAASAWPGWHTFYEYVGRRLPEMLRACAQVAAIPVKRCPLPETRFMARDEVDALFARLLADGRLALRERTFLPARAAAYRVATT